MTDQTAWHFLLNPAAGRGKAMRRWREILPQLKAALPNMTVAQSTPEDGMAALAEAAVRAGKTFLVGAGGDGTHHDIVNGIVRAGGLGRVTYAPLPLGTGNDWVRTLKTPRRTAQWLDMIYRKITMKHRVGKLEYAPIVTSATTALPITHYPLQTTYFINVAGLAYDAEVVRRSETARIKHPLLYPLYTLRYLKDFTPPWAVVRYNDEVLKGYVHTINLGIGRYNGGGMQLVPHADPTADTFALTVARKLPIGKIIKSSWRFYTDTIGAIDEVTTAHSDRVVITPAQDIVTLEADGELLGVAPVTATLLNEYLRVVVP